MQIAGKHALGQMGDVSNRSTRRLTVHEALGRIRHGIVAANPRRQGSRHKVEATGGPANQTVRGWTAFAGTEFPDYLRVG